MMANAHDEHDIPRLTSSPEAYAASLNLTAAEVRATYEERRQRTAALYERIANADEAELDGPSRHALICRHRYESGRHPHICPRCFTYRPVCVCDDASTPPRPLPPGLGECARKK